MHNAEGLHLSTDGGETFRPSGPWQDGVWSVFAGIDAIPSAAGLSAVAVQSLWPAGTAHLQRTDDGGRTWTPLRIDLPGFEFGAAGPFVTPTGASS